MKKVFILFFIFCFNVLIPVSAETVVYNPESKIYHSVNCQHAIRCKKCIKTEKSVAKQNGARPCKVCGNKIAK